MDPTTNLTADPGSRPRRGIALVLVLALVAGIVTVAAVVGSTDRAEAAGLERFGSCPELRSWGASSTRAQVSFGGDVAMSSTGTPATTAAPTVTGARDDAANGVAEGAAASEVGATNVAVDGVDELDVVDRIGGDRVLVVAGDRLAIVDLGDAEVVARRTIPVGAQVTYDGTRRLAWIVAPTSDGAHVEVERMSVTDAGLEPAGSWSIPGVLVDARRIGGDLHLVATDGFGQAGTSVPFAGGPVACDQVLHPAGTSAPTATLLVTLPGRGDLKPSHSAEVVGSGQFVHVTTDAAYLATPQWDGGDMRTALHRFDLSDLTHTGSGSVPGSLLNDFSMDDHDGRLRVAITDARATAMPMPEPMPMPAPAPAPAPSPAPTDGSPGPSVDDLGSSGAAPADVGGGQDAVSSPPLPQTTVPQTTVPQTTVPDPASARNRVVVLDTDGDLDIVGQTPWFGHPGEALQGIRFDGDRAYAVTYLNTDPFFVLDLSDPTAPKVAGEVALPGFSSYLHPLGGGMVVGFGPDGRGQVAAKLFDVSQPARPVLRDTVVLGDDSPVVSDHHAFVDLDDGRFAVPVDRWSSVITEKPMDPCADIPEREQGCDSLGPRPGPRLGVESAVVELRVVDGHLREVRRSSANLTVPATRAIPSDDGWALLGGSELGFVRADGSFRTLLDLSA